jgi:hypothetical protein
MHSSKDYIRQNKTALFDWLVFWISLSLGFIYPSLRDFVISPSFSYWMMTALLLYSIGAMLKHLPLYYRLISSGKSPRQISYLLLLVTGHWIIIYILH